MKQPAKAVCDCNLKELRILFALDQVYQQLLGYDQKLEEMGNHL